MSELKANPYGPWRFYHHCATGTFTGVTRGPTEAGTGLAIDLSHSHPTLANLLRVLVTDTTIHGRMMDIDGFVVGTAPNGWQYGLYIYLEMGDHSETAILAPSDSPIWWQYLEADGPDREERWDRS